MIENMKVEFGRTSDIDSWMRLVRKVSWKFPGLETEQSINEHKIIVLKFMNDKRALCVKNEQDIVGVLLYSRKHNMISILFDIYAPYNKFSLQRIRIYFYFNTIRCILPKSLSSFNKKCKRFVFLLARKEGWNV